MMFSGALGIFARSKLLVTVSSVMYTRAARLGLQSRYCTLTAATAAMVFLNVLLRADSRYCALAAATAAMSNLKGVSLSQVWILLNVPGPSVP